MQRTRRRSIQIRQIFPCNRAKPVQIKMRVSILKRVKRPNDQPNSPPQRFFALKKFQSPPNSPVAILRKHARHVRVQKNRPVSKSDKRQGVANQTFSIERAQDLPARFLRHDKQSRRLDFNVRLRPKFLFCRSTHR